jgi:hypothetical protein
MSENVRVEMREVHERIVDRLRAAQARAPKTPEARQLQPRGPSRGHDAGR